METIIVRAVFIKRPFKTVRMRPHRVTAGFYFLSLKLWWIVIPPLEWGLGCVSVLDPGCARSTRGRGHMWVCNASLFLKEKETS